MPTVTALDQINFDLMRIGTRYYLDGFTPDMTTEARRLLALRAAAIGARPLYRTDPPVPLISLGHASPTTGPKPPGRPLSIESLLVKELAVGGSTTIALGERHPTSIRNRAVAWGKSFKRKYSVTMSADKEHFTITRTA